MNPLDPLLIEKRHAEEALGAARKRLSDAQRDFMSKEVAFRRAQKRWLDSSECRAAPERRGGAPCANA